MFHISAETLKGVFAAGGQNELFCEKRKRSNGGVVADRSRNRKKIFFPFPRNEMTSVPFHIPMYTAFAQSQGLVE